MHQLTNQLMYFIINDSAVCTITNVKHFRKFSELFLGGTKNFRTAEKMLDQFYNRV